MSSRDAGLSPATDGQVAAAARLLTELNNASFGQLRAWAAGSRAIPEPERLRLRLLGLIERFVVEGEITPKVLGQRLPGRMAKGLGTERADAAAQEALRQIAAQLAAVLLVERWPAGIQAWFDTMRPRLLRAAPEIIPWLFQRVASVHAAELMASWGLAISEEHATQIEPALRAQGEAVERGVKVFYERLRSEAPMDVVGLADAALDDFEDLTSGLRRIKNEVLQ